MKRIVISGGVNSQFWSKTKKFLAIWVIGIFFPFLIVSCDKEDNGLDYDIIRVEGPEYLNAPNERDLLDPTPYNIGKYWLADSYADFWDYFRTSYDEFIYPNESNCPPQYNSSYTPSREGMSSLKMSGSGEFPPSILEEMLGVIRKVHSGDIAVVDLRSETHGYLNNQCVFTKGLRNWCNIGKTTDFIQNEEESIFHSLLGEDMYIHNSAKDSTMWSVTESYTERELCDRYGLQYKRIAALDYAPFPSDVLLESFVTYVKDLPSNTWVHFHCALGKGRTTLYMVLYDMIRNPNLSIEDIIYRQYLIGGAFLFDEKNERPEEWRREIAKEKITLLPIFYQYVKQCHKQHFSLSWSEWKRLKFI